MAITVHWLAQPNDGTNQMERGFSLIEVLVSLILLASISLLLLKHLVQMSQLLNQITVQIDKNTIIENQCESLEAVCRD